MKHTQNHYKKVMDIISDSVKSTINSMDILTAKNCLKIVLQYTHTNCGYTNFYMKEPFIKLLVSRIEILEYLQEKKQSEKN